MSRLSRPGAPPRSRGEMCLALREIVQTESGRMRGQAATRKPGPALKMAELSTLACTDATRATQEQAEAPTSRPSRPT